MGEELKSMANGQTLELKSRISIEDISGPERFLLGEELKECGQQSDNEVEK